MILRFWCSADPWSGWHFWWSVQGIRWQLHRRVPTKWWSTMEERGCTIWNILDCRRTWSWCCSHHLQHGTMCFQNNTKKRNSTRGNFEMQHCTASCWLFRRWRVLREWCQRLHIGTFWWHCPRWNHWLLMRRSWQDFETYQWMNLPSPIFLSPIGRFFVSYIFFSIKSSYETSKMTKPFHFCAYGFFSFIFRFYVWK